MGHIYFAQVEGDYWHLRSHENNKGMLIINGVKVIYLNPSAFDYMKMFFESKQSHSKVILKAVTKFGISPFKARRDWQRLYSDLVKAAKGCCQGAAIRMLEEDEPLTAPLRVDLALTYRCNNDCSHCYVGGSRETEELSTSEWQGIIDKLHAFGVPQVIFTGGESLLRDDLEVLVSFAKQRNFITGLITNGRLLTKERVKSLEQAGLDYVQITVESSIPEIHDSMVGCAAFSETIAGLTNTSASSIRVTTNTTVTAINVDGILDTVAFLIKIGSTSIGVNGIIRANRGVESEGVEPAILKEKLRCIRDLCHEAGVSFTWFTPTCYLELDPLTLDLGCRRCSAASVVLAVEPFGRVIPCQSYFKEGLGDGRYDSFEEMWNKPLAVALRERTWVDEKCRTCSRFTFCGGGCPLEQTEGCGY